MKYTHHLPFLDSHMKTILLFAALCLSLPATADDASKRAKILQLTKAQGLEQMFQQQLDSSKVELIKIGDDMFTGLMAENGVAAGAKDAEARKIMSKYLERMVSTISAKQYTDTWTSLYGQDLSEADIDKILAYYTSPLGQRDVKASQSAMEKFTPLVNKASAKEMTTLLVEMERELKALMVK